MCDMSLVEQHRQTGMIPVNFVHNLCIVFDVVLPPIEKSGLFLWSLEKFRQPPAVKNRRFFAQDISHNGVRLGDEDNKKPKDDIVR